MSKELVEIRYEPEPGGIAPLVDFEKLIPTPEAFSSADGCFWA